MLSFVPEIRSRRRHADTEQRIWSEYDPPPAEPT
jgi:hypothetical protein